MIYVGNAFSLQMLTADECTVRVRTVNPLDVYRLLDGEQTSWTSCVGHADTAAVFSAALGLAVPHARQNVTLLPGDVLFVGQLTGGRLPEGATSLPEGFQLVWRRVEIVVE